jgi:hypothetical protein
LSLRQVLGCVGSETWDETFSKNVEKASVSISFVKFTVREAQPDDHRQGSRSQMFAEDCGLCNELLLAHPWQRPLESSGLGMKRVNMKRWGHARGHGQDVIEIC